MDSGKLACINFTEITTVADADSNLRFVENHYPAPPVDPTPSAPPLAVSDGLTPSSPMQFEVGFVNSLYSNIIRVVKKHWRPVISPATLIPSFASYILLVKIEKI